MREVAARKEERGMPGATKAGAMARVEDGGKGTGEEEGRMSKVGGRRRMGMRRKEELFFIGLKKRNGIVRRWLLGGRAARGADMGAGYGPVVAQISRRWPMGGQQVGCEMRSGARRPHGLGGADLSAKGGGLFLPARSQLATRRALWKTLRGFPLVTPEH